MTPTKTATCANCGNGLEPNAKFCPACGTATSGIFSGGGSPLAGTAIVMAEDADTLFPILQDATLGDYDIYGELGRGGMAAVYLALDLALNRKVAIKTMLPDLVQREGMVARFKREAQTAAGLSHPHIIQIFSVKETQRLVYFVMKYIEGRSLEAIMQEQGALSVELTRAVLSQAGGALAFAHRKGVFHRDVKPANIMLDEDGWAIVTDFGIAKVSDATNLTGTGTAIGTPHYMSPEQFHNKNVSGASDQYSLGVVAYELLSGRKPYDGGTYAEILTQHLFEPPPDIRAVRADVPANIAEAIMKMMAKDAKDRFANVDEAIAAFGEASQAEQAAVRKQMAELAKSGAPRKIRMSVPVSPVPQGKRTAVGRTQAERAGAATRAMTPNVPATAQQQKKKSKAGVYVLTAILGAAAVAGIVVGTVKYMQPPARSSVTPPVATQTQAAAQSPAPTTPANTQPAADSAKPAVDSASVVAKPPAPETKAPKTKAEKSKSQVADGGTKTKSTKTTKSAAATPVVQQAGSSASSTTANSTQTKSAQTPPQQPVQQAPAPAAQPQTPAAPPAPGSARIGTSTENAYLYINGVVQGKPLGRLETVNVPAGQVHLTIKADKCTPWDSTISVKSGETSTVGHRNLSCP